MIDERFEHAPCPRCHASDSTPVTSGRDVLHGIPGTFTAVECRGCGLWFLNPRPKADQLSAMYPDEYAPHADAVDDGTPRWLRLLGKVRDVAISRRRYEAHELGYDGPDGRPRSPLTFYARWKAGVDLVPRFVRDGRLLEIGCASGARLAELRRLGWHDLHGVELVPAAAARARAQGFDVRTGRIEPTLDELEDGSFDAVIMSMVLEHLQDPFAVIAQIRRKLRPGGELLLSTVVRDSIDGRLFGDYWAGFDFPRHLVFFTKEDLLAPLREHFREIDTYHQNQPLDFVVSASWRQRGVLDRAIARAASSRLAELPGVALALSRLTTRVSLRCRA